MKSRSSNSWEIQNITEIDIPLDFSISYKESSKCKSFSKLQFIAEHGHKGQTLGYPLITLMCIYC